jgi:hypothetical protein
MTQKLTVVATAALALALGCGPDGELESMSQALTAEGFTTSATATPSSVTPGSTVELVSTVVSAKRTTAHFQVSVRDSAGARHFSTAVARQRFRAHRPRSFQTIWAVPAGLPAGSYAVEVQVAEGGARPHLNSHAAAVVVTEPASAPPPGSSPSLLSEAWIFDDALAPGFANWSWSASVNLAVSAPVWSGSRALAFTISAPWGGLYLNTRESIDTTPFSALRFAAQASAPAQPFSVALYGEDGRRLGPAVPLETVGGYPPVGGWRVYEVPLSSLGAQQQRVAGVVFQDRAGSPQPALYLDALALVGTSSAAPAPTTDALASRVRAELRLFTDWLAANGVKGFLGEVGWPDDVKGEAALWNGLARAWFEEAAAAQLWVTAWATGDWWSTTSQMAIYRRGVANTQAPVIEEQAARSSWLGGINVAGAEFATPNVQATTAFSNVNPGTHGKEYIYPSQGLLDLLASRGIRVIRLPFRWERLQRVPGQAFDSAELGLLRDAVARARQSGLSVILDVHNYGAYYLFDGSQGVRRAIGTSQLPITHFADLWRRLSATFAADPTVIGYGLMNEPVQLPSVNGASPAQVWEQASQAAVSAIRQNGDSKLVLVPGYFWSGVKHLPAQHPKAWIVDPAANLRYEAHHYFDRDNSGNYRYSYAEELEDAKARGFR